MAVAGIRSVSELCRRAGISRTNIFVAKQKGRLTDGVAQKLGAILGCPPAALKGEA